MRDMRLWSTGSRPSAGAVLLALWRRPRAVAPRRYTWRNVEIVGGGFVPGIVFNQTEPDLVYARTDIGGAYRWNPATIAGSRCSTGSAATTGT